MNALVVADEGGLVSGVGLALRLRWPDLELVSAETACEGRRILADKRPDVLFVSALLPNSDTLTMVREIRRESDIVIFVIGTSNEELDMVEALEAGSDEYLSTPIHECVLVTRVCAALRRSRKSGTSEGAALQCGDLAIDRETHEACLKGKPLCVTPTEFTLLYHLAERPGRVLTHRALESAIWGHEDNLNSDVLRKHVQHLRRKLESPRGSHMTIVTVPRVGYKLMEKKAAHNRRQATPQRTISDAR
jgi:two-component system KDP operon response regulator KdpE